MTEMVVVAPALLLVMAAIVQFSMLFGDKLQLNYASYRRARGAVLDEDGQVRRFVDETLTKVMPRAYPVSDKAEVLLGTNSEAIDILVATSTVECKSQLLLPGVFDAKSLANVSREEGKYFVQLRARGFSPAVVLSVKEKDGVVWYLPWTWFR